MRKILFTAIAAMVALCAGAQNGTPAAELLARMERMQWRGVMLGHQDDPMYGTTWKYEAGRSDVKDVCGDYPAVMGFDLGKIEYGSERNLDGVPFSLMRDEIRAQHERGGIVTLSWHPGNPATGGNSWDAKGRAVGKLLPGASLASVCDEWLGRVADFIGSLKDKDGRRIPVIFRPWHEMNGAWFWWGCDSCTPEEYRRLYIHTHDFLTARGLDNIVWAYSPNLSNGTPTEESYLLYYPGDRYVDLLGTDVYQQSADNASYRADVRKELKVVTAVGRSRGKLTALTETGHRGVPYERWFTECLLPVITEFPISYVLLWRNAWDNPEENFCAAPDKAVAPDFVKFHDYASTLFIKDVAGLR